MTFDQLKIENAALRQYIKDVHHVVEPLVGLLRMRDDDKLKTRADKVMEVMSPSDELMAIIRGVNS